MSGNASLAEASVVGPIFQSTELDYSINSSGSNNNKNNDSNTNSHTNNGIMNINNSFSNDNDNNSISNNTSDSFHQDQWSVWAWYLGMVLPPVLCALGLPCNLANVVVIWRRWTFSSPIIYMVVLSLTDSVALTHKIMMMHFPTLGVPVTSEGCRYLQFVLQWATHMSSWTLVLLSAERALVVRFPFSRAAFSTRRALYTLAITAVILAALNCHWLFVVTSTADSRYCIHSADFQRFFKHISYFIETFTFAFIPCVCLVVSNSILVVSLYPRQRQRTKSRNSFVQALRGFAWRRQSSSANPSTPATQNAREREADAAKEESDDKFLPSPALRLANRQFKQITVSTLIASVVFFLLTTPYCIKKLQPYSNDKGRHLFFSTVTYILRDATHTVNFFVYSLPGMGFSCRCWSIRQTCYSIQGCLKRGTKRIPVGTMTPMYRVQQPASQGTSSQSTSTPL